MNRTMILILILSMGACPPGSDGEKPEKEQVHSFQAEDMNLLLSEFEVMLRRVPASPATVGFRLSPGGGVSNAAIVQCAPEVSGRWSYTSAGIKVHYAIERPTPSDLEASVGCREEIEELLAMPEMPSGQFSVKTMQCKSVFDCRGTATLSSGATASLVIPGYPR